VRELINQISNDFHLIRPELLWLLVPLFFLSLLLFRKSSSEDRWKKHLPEHLAQYLIIKGKENSKLPRILMIILLLIMVFAVSGPTWREIDKGGVKSRSSLIIALDLSRSMLATDIQPNRLERAKSKIEDLLDLRIGMPSALVGFAGTAHTILHFTNDYNTIKYLLEYSSPGIMPVKGTGFKPLFNLADSLFKPFELPGAILILTDDLPESELNLVRQFAEESNTKIEFLLISTPGGAPIPVSKNKFLKDENGKTVIPLLNTNSITRFAEIKNTRVNLITLDNSDLESVVSSLKENIEFEKLKEEENREWEDYGYWFMIPAVLLLLFWFRKGWVVSWIIVIYLLPGYGCSFEKSNDFEKEGFEFADLWFTSDQQGQNLFDDGDFVSAAEKFEDLYWKGVSYYMAKEYQLAAQTFYQLKTPQGYYNIGMCMAEMENWSEAIFAFEQALELNPDFKEAEHNLSEIKKLIPEKRNIELVTPQSFEDKMFGKSEELDQESDEEGDEEETEGGDQQLQEDLAKQIAPGQEQFSLPNENDLQSEKQDRKDALLNQMSDNPAVFLKRKFAMQYRKMKEKIEKPKNKW
jgi:Ca-activated chloride channel family protein